MGIYRAITGLFGATRGFFLPFGLAAVIALGVHLGSDAAQNGAFWALNLVDHLLEAVVEILLGLIQGTGVPESDWAARNGWRFAAWIDFDTLELWASWTAVGLELLIDLMMLRIALGYDETPPPYIPTDPDHSRARQWMTVTTGRWRIEGRGMLDYWRDPTVEKLYVPFACLCAVLAGSIGIAVGLETLLYAQLAKVPRFDATSPWLTTAPAFLIAAIIAVRLGLPASGHAFVWAENRNQGRRQDGMHPWKRRFKGLIPALVIVPVTAAALLVGTPIVRWLELRG